MAIFGFLPRITRPLLSLGLLSVSALSYGAVAAPQITQPIQNHQRVTLRGNVRPLPARARDLGAVDTGLPASRVQLLLKRPAEQEAALAQFLNDVQMPDSPVYHKWMTPEQFGSEFGPAEQDVQAVVGWLQAQGFAVAKVSKSRTFIEFSGTAGQIEHTFGAQIHSFEVDGENHISNITDPQIPAALSPVVAGISPLNDFRMKPMHSAPAARLAEPAPTSANPRAMAIHAVNRPSSSLQPDLTNPGANGNPNTFYVTPGDLATIYNTPNSTLNTKFSASANLTGSGVTVGIAGVSNVDLANITHYRSLFGLQALTPKVTIDGNDPGVLGDSAVEALLDLEQVSAVAPAANLTLYIAQDTTFQQGLFLAIQRAIDENAISILNVSFGGCEAYQGQAGNQEVLNFWQQAAAQGISVTVSTGDSGAAGCDSANAAAAAQGLQVNALASTPYNIAVGGTDFNETSSNSAQFWNAANSGIFESALGYIPEIPWNNSTSTIGSLASNVAFKDAQGNTRIDGAGGGISGCLNATVDSNGNITACANAYGQPAWQSSFGPGGARQLPDVSLFAANGGHLAAYLLCASGLGGDAATDVDCSPDSQGAFSFQGVGGTSASSPVFAGMLALVLQSQQTSTGNAALRLGQADYTLYPLSKQHPAAFHDVATGNISVVCAAGTPGCGANGFLTGYNATSGYDLASGLGSIDVTQMVQNWTNITFKGTTTSLRLNGSTSALTITHGSAVTVAATVTGTGGTPTGDVALVNNSSTAATAVAAVQSTTPSPSIFTLSNGNAGGSYAYLPGGSYTVKANYDGDGIFGESVSNGISVTVAAEASTLGLSIDAFAVANNPKVLASSINGGMVPYGTYISVSAQPVSSAHANMTVPTLATGTIQFTSAVSVLNQSDPINSNGYAEIAGQTGLAYPPGAYSVSASYSGDPSFSASSAAAQTFTITKANTQLAAAPASGTGSLTVEVDPNNQTYYTNGGAALPTGTVAVANSAGATVGTAVLAKVTLSNGGSAAQATVTLDTTKLTVGANALNISYPGDTNYNASGPASFTYTLTTGGGGSANFTLSAAPLSVTVPSGGSASTTVSVTPKSGFTGTVNLSCSVAGGTTLLPTCAFATTSVTISNSGAATDVLTIATQTSSAALHIPAAPADRTWYTAGGTVLAGLLLLGVPGRRRAWQRSLSLLLVIAGIGFAGCGGSSGSSHTTPAGSYTVTVTATSGTSSTTSTVAVTVQ